MSVRRPTALSSSLAVGDRAALLRQPNVEKTTVVAGVEATRGQIVVGVQFVQVLQQAIDGATALGDYPVSLVAFARLVIVLGSG
jgi:hypothetical protein